MGKAYRGATGDGDFIEIADPSTGTVVEVVNAAPRPYAAYVCGPMTGRPNFNYDAFHAVELHIISKGLPGIARPLVVLNPARNFGGDQTLPRRKYLAKAIAQVHISDALVLLPEWYKSEGAQLEVTWALNAGKDFYVAIFSELDGGWRIQPVEREAVEVVLVSLGDKIYEAADKAHEPIEIEAGELVRRGARRRTYGHPRGDFDRIALIWSGILGIKVTAEQVALCMAGLKLARLAETPQHRDSKVDAIGYIVCLDELDEEEAA